MTLVGMGTGLLCGSIAGWYWPLESDALPRTHSRVVPIAVPHWNARGQVDRLLLGGGFAF